MCLHIRAGERIIERNSVTCGEHAAGAKFGPSPRPVFRFSAAAARFETLVTQSGADHGSDYRPGPGVTVRGRREIMPRTQHRCTASCAMMRCTGRRRVPLERHSALHAHIVQFVVHESVGTHEATVSRLVRPGHRLTSALGSSRWPTTCSADAVGQWFHLGQAGIGESIARHAWRRYGALTVHDAPRQLGSAGACAQGSLPIPGTVNVEGLPVRLKFPHYLS